MPLDSHRLPNAACWGTLSTADLELITLIAMEGYRQSEVARMWGCSRNAINKRMQKIKAILRKG